MIGFELLSTITKPEVSFLSPGGVVFDSPPEFSGSEEHPKLNKIKINVAK
jgi:hypothetical protein